ncbi:MAG: DUF362 domain-containing protein [Candidatus Hydrogenedentota bacterium]
MAPTEKPDQSPDYESAPMNRRAFMRRAGVAGAITVGAGYIAFAPEDAPFSLRDASGKRSVVEPTPFRLGNFRVEKPKGTTQDIGIARGKALNPGRYTIEEKRNLLKAALDAVGGIEHYVKPGETVLIKPNVAFDRSANMGATSDPEMVGELVRMLYRDAKALEVRVADNPIENAVDCFRKTGIGPATISAGGRVHLPTEQSFRVLNTPGASLIEYWPFFATPFKHVDKVIGLCPVKDHNLCGASISIKNWMGLLGGTRNQFHDDIHNLLSDLALMMKPTLSIIDGTRVLAEMGPTGGDISFVKDGDVVLAGLDPVAMDAWAFEHCLHRGTDYPEYLAMAEQKGGGQVDWAGRIKEVTV